MCLVGLTMDIKMKRWAASTNTCRTLLSANSKYTKNALLTNHN